MQKHLAYNTATGEILTIDRGNSLKRWLARHNANDRKYYATIGKPCSPSRWVFAHGKNYDDCVAKLTVRGIWG